MSTYRIETPNKNYSATWLGVKFTNGVGITENDAHANAARVLGYTVTSDTPEEVKPLERLTEPPVVRKTRKPRTVKKDG